MKSTKASTVVAMQLLNGTQEKKMPLQMRLQGSLGIENCFNLMVILKSA